MPTILACSGADETLTEGFAALHREQLDDVG
jgi:hypothetical protein